MMMWDTTSDTRVTVSADALWRVGELIDVQIWPSVLNMSLAYDTIEAYQDGMRRAEDELRGAGLLGPEGVDDGLHLALQVLTRSECGLQARIFGTDGVRRVALARRGRDHVLALRFGDSITIETVAVDGVQTAAQRIIACLGDATAADVGSISAPTGDVVRRLDEATTPAGYTDALYALGADEREAMKLGTALADCHGYTEIVAVESWEGRTQQSSGAVVVYETVRGRVVGSPSVSPDGQMWTTLSAGSGHRIKQAIGLLVETLPSGQWMP
ncbi:ESX secretion-associated protein EspG [Gordonia sp. CPCC 205515]|uniref:ESX secretion-associated protein EspG n=1 Tax=Gordonia sp. CPCC 205515 TaxID=3140791 RepID=UPI003AF3D3F3